MEDKTKTKEEVTKQAAAGETQTSSENETSENSAENTEQREPISFTEKSNTEIETSDSSEEPNEEPNEEPREGSAEETGATDTAANSGVDKRTFTQEQVNSMVGRARIEGRESAMKELLERYGVTSDDELNGIFGKGQTYDDLNDEYLGQTHSLKEALAENALLKSKIKPERWDDVKFILGGKALEITPENIAANLATHPEWVDSGSAPDNSTEDRVLTPEAAEDRAKQVATLRKLGNEPSGHEQPEETEEEVAKKLYGGF